MRDRDYGLFQRAGWDRDRLRKALEDSAKGNTVDLGDFTQSADDEIKDDE